MNRQRTGQVILETALSLVGSLVLFFGMIVIWDWVNRSLIGREVGDQAFQGYQQTRLAAGQLKSAGTETHNPYQQLRLSIFGERAGERLTSDTNNASGSRGSRRKAGGLGGH